MSIFYFFLLMTFCSAWSADFSAYEYSLQIHPKIDRDSRWPDHLTFSEVSPAFTKEAFVTLLSAGRWRLSFLCEGAAIPAEKFTNVNLTAGIDSDFEAFEFRNHVRLCRGGRLSDIYNHPDMSLLDVQKCQDIPAGGIYEGGTNRFFIGHLFYPHPVHPLRINENQEVVIELDLWSATNYSEMVCSSPSKILKGYLIKEMVPTS